MSDDGDLGRSSAPVRSGTILGHFIDCWRGDARLWDAFLASVIVFAILVLPVALLREYAHSSGWPPHTQSMLLLLQATVAPLFVVWFTVSMWRSARRNFLLGQRFWPIVASLTAAVVVAMWLANFIGTVLLAPR
jgi:hypothetical protein